MSSFSIRVNIGELLAGYDATLRQIEDAARPAAQAGAQVLYDEVKRNVARIRRKTGKLAASIYQVYSKSNSGQGHATYHVSWNAKKAPHGHLVEFGHLQRYEVTHDPKTGRFITHRDRPLASPKQIPAYPFVRPAVSKLPAAEQAMRDRFFAELADKGMIR